MTTTNDSNFYVNALLSIKGPRMHFDKCDGLWASCKRLYENRPLLTLPESGELKDVSARPVTRVPNAEAMKTSIPHHLMGTLWIMNSDVIRGMVERGIEWPVEMRRVRVTVFEEITRDVVNAFKAVFQERERRPESVCLKISMRTYYTDNHEALMIELYKTARLV
jgi:hypothetical protein